MFLVFLKFSDNKSQAKQFMDSHNKWINQGFDDDVFLMVGSLKDGSGGSVMAHNTTIDELESRVNNDPFVAENIVAPEIIEITPAKCNTRLNFLLP